MSGEINAMIDRLVSVLTPTPPAKTTIDGSCSEPIAPGPQWDANHRAMIYAYPLLRSRAPKGVCREDFVVELLYVVDDQGEQDEEERMRAIADRLDQQSTSWLQAICDNEKDTTDLWAFIGGAVDYDEVRRLELRGVGVRVTGYRFVC